MLYCFTTCAFNYLPNAVVLGQSISKHLPDAKRVLMITDNVPDGYDASWSGFDEVWLLSELNRDFDCVEPWVFCHTVMELATAVKGFVLRQLLGRDDCDAAIFFDPDCELHSSVDQVITSLHSHDIVLTPHTSLPHLNSEWIKFEINQHRVGVFNLGFIAVANTVGGREFAEWWWDRLKRHCIIDPALYLFTDQKWIDLVPCYFDRVAVLRSPTMNLARWNTFQRVVTLGDAEEILVDGEPLDFIHYSGFLKIGSENRGLYDVLSKPWVADIKVLDDLSQKYAERLHLNQQRPECSADWGYTSYTNGTEIPIAHRRAFKARPGLWPDFPNPFEGSDEFTERMQELSQDLRPEKEHRLSLLGQLRRLVR